MNRHRQLLCTLLILVPLVAAGVAGCQSTEVTSGPTSVTKCQVTLGPLGTIGSSGATATITVTAPRECGWDASTQASWISGLTPASGQGNGTLEFQVAPNPAPSIRETDVLINQEPLRVSQEAAPCVYSIAPNDLTVSAAGGTGTINLSTLNGCSWSGVSDVPWITITSGASGDGNGAVVFSVASNAGGTREGNLRIAGQVATITQSASATSPTPSPTPPPCSYAITPTSYSASANGGPGPTVSVSAGSGCNWTASSNDSWITLVSGAIGAGNGLVDFTVGANPYNVRNGTLTIAGKTLTVQQGTNCTFVLNRTDITIPANPAPGVTRAVNVNTSGPLCNWTASTSTPWITIVSGTSYVGSDTVYFSAPTNTGSTRTGTLIVAGQTVTVTQ